MNIIILAAAAASVLFFATPASAQTADDRRWIAQCLKDNADAKVSVEIVRRYCTCMNDKMDETETRSITQWEKANPAARRGCEREAGWT